MLVQQHLFRPCFNPYIAITDLFFDPVNLTLLPAQIGFAALLGELHRVVGSSPGEGAVLVAPTTLGFCQSRVGRRGIGAVFVFVAVFGEHDGVNCPVVRNEGDGICGESVSKWAVFNDRTACELMHHTSSVYKIM